MRSVHRLEHVPTHSNILVADRDAALAHPTGTLDLSVCSACGFIANTAFDPALVRYAEGYEETQAFSPRFRSFLEELTDGLAERHALSGRRVLEVGSGSGDFLRMLCATAGCTGVGYDPAHRGPVHDADGRVTFVPEHFGPEHADSSFDLVCCRHTLEHLPDVRGVVTLLRRAMRTGSGAMVIEVPDTTRILRERAFWDVYYEHCSYFTLGSLGRLLQACGMAIDRLRLAYGDQYVIAEAHGGDGGSPPPDDRAETLELAGDFGVEVRATLDHWRGQVTARRDDGRAVAIWGAGSKAVGFLTGLGADLADHVSHVVDINPAKQGTYLPGSGRPIVAPSALASARPDLVIAMNPIYLDEIGAELSRLGLTPTLMGLS